MKATTQFDHKFQFLTGFICSCCLAIGMVRFSWTAEAGCIDLQPNFNLIARNLMIVGGLYLLLLLFKDADEKISDLGMINWILCRYMLIYALIPGAINKISNIHYQYSYSNSSERVLNLDPSGLLWQLYSASDSYEWLIGVGQILVILMLTFRKTTPIAALLLLPILINNLAFALVFDSCYLLSYISYLTFAVGAIIYLLPIFLRWMKTLKFHKLLGLNPKQRNHFLKSFGIFKIIIITGLMMQQLWMVDRSRNYYRMKKNHPLIGVWTVDTLRASTEDFPKFNRLIFEQSIVGNVEVSDSLSRFYYIVDTTYHQMEFYNFHEYRDLDLKGKYKLIDSNRIEYVGRNNKDSLFFTLIKQQDRLKKK